MSMLDLLISNDDALDTHIDEAEVRAACEAALAALGIDGGAELSVSFVSADEMRALNARWRGIDAPTDVLSFSLIEGEGAGEAPGPEPLELGDIILAPEVIARQAGEFGNTPTEECRLMLVHGMLHLLGYDHMNEADAARMEARELEVLRALATARGEDPDAVRIGPTTRHADD